MLQLIGQNNNSSNQNPLRTPLDELIHQSPNICQHEATHIEPEELCCVTDAQFQANVSRRRALEAGIFDLASDLIYGELMSVDFQSSVLLYLVKRRSMVVSCGGRARGEFAVWMLKF
jgi:hypothetical protein